MLMTLFDNRHTGFSDNAANIGILIVCKIDHFTLVEEILSLDLFDQFPINLNCKDRHDASLNYLKQHSKQKANIQIKFLICNAASFSSLALDFNRRFSGLGLLLGG
jgi:hypothetical protein